MTVKNMDRITLKRCFVIVMCILVGHWCVSVLQKTLTLGYSQILMVTPFKLCLMIAAIGLYMHVSKHKHRL